MIKVPRNLPHGTMYGYQVLKCRCNECKVAYRKRLSDRREYMDNHPESPYHGLTTGYYTWQCRCERCTDAMRDYEARRKA